MVFLNRVVWIPREFQNYQACGKIVEVWQAVLFNLIFFLPFNFSIV